MGNTVGTRTGEGGQAHTAVEVADGATGGEEDISKGAETSSGGDNGEAAYRQVQRGTLAASTQWKYLSRE